MNDLAAVLDANRKLLGRENAATKARRLLIEGRVQIVRADRREVLARVRGDSGWHRVVCSNGWRCDCEAMSVRCSHVQAVSLVWLPGASWEP